MQLLEECDFNILYASVKIIINGEWYGVNENPEELIKLFKQYRRVGLISPFISINWDIEKNEINFYTDTGRLCRPLIYYEDDKLNIERKEVLEKLESSNFKWKDLVTGFGKEIIENYNYEDCNIHSLKKLYGIENIKQLQSSQCVLEYLDTSESEGALIQINYNAKDKSKNKKKYTHLEIHPSLLLGVMSNQIVFPENNQLPRDLFFCGQAKQAVSLYHSNYFSRIDKTGIVLNYGQKPLVKSRYLQYINNEEHPYGENVIVAIMVYGGYNVEDAILVNEGSVNRGLFGTTYYNMYETRETSSNVGKNNLDSHITNIEKESNIIGKKPGYDFSHLDEYGLVKENTKMDENITVIGKVTNNIEEPGILIDSSVYPKKGQTGYVDKTFMTEDEEGFRLAKIRVRDNRIPAIGDKFCSRCGQKGTIGLLIPENDMPYTDEGIKPDIIVNPHALPSRMTIGQLVESLMGKACLNVGTFGDCTAFVNKGSKHKAFGKVLTENGYHSSGNQVLYNGMTGEQLESEIFIGPTYYMRLKHMVKDKINYRSKGPRTSLTRQVVQGRANDGGLRIGEMERDCLISLGVNAFLKESLLVRGDDYQVAVCNCTGTIAIYNEQKNIFLSPLADGPIKFTNISQYDANIEVISKFGRSFSIIRIPYAFKLLYQELLTMNIQMRIVTEDNIDQFMSMNYSDNVNKLMHLNTKEYKLDNLLNSVIRKARDQIYESKPNNDLPKTEEKPEPLLKPVNNISPESFGWIFDIFSEDKGEIYKSLILDDKGETTEIWYSEENDKKIPNRYPNGWKVEDLYYDNGLPILPEIIIEQLSEIRDPDNWILGLENILSYNIGNPFDSIDIPDMPEYDRAHLAPRKRFIEEYKSIYPNITDHQGDYAYSVYVNNKKIVPPERLNDYSPPFPYDTTSPLYNPNSPTYTPPGSPAYNPNSPYSSPPYAPGSPAYNPNTPPSSPPYAPGSPAYNPNTPPSSPPYAPGSPAYNPNTPPSSPPYAPSSPNYPPPNKNVGYRIDSTSSDGSIPPPPASNNTPRFKYNRSTRRSYYTKR